MNDKSVLTMLSAIVVCLVDQSEHMQLEKDAPPEKVIRMENVINVIEDFKADVEKEIKRKMESMNK